MLPSSSLKLKLSKMSMGGIGGKMMRSIMKHKGIDSLESLRRQALENGVEFIACQMSMDVMGVKKEELLDEITIGGRIWNAPTMRTLTCLYKKINENNMHNARYLQSPRGL